MFSIWFNILTLGSHRKGFPLSNHTLLSQAKAHEGGIYQQRSTRSQSAVGGNLTKAKGKVFQSPDFTPGCTFPRERHCQRRQLHSPGVCHPL